MEISSPSNQESDGLVSDLRLRAVGEFTVRRTEVRFLPPLTLCLRAATSNLSNQVSTRDSLKMPPKVKGKKGKKVDDDEYWYCLTLVYLHIGS